MPADGKNNVTTIVRLPLGTVHVLLTDDPHGLAAATPGATGPWYPAKNKRGMRVATITAASPMAGNRRTRWDLETTAGEVNNLTPQQTFWLADPATNGPAVAITSQADQAADGSRRYELSNGWFIMREHYAHRRAYREHPYAAYVPGAGEHGIAKCIGTAKKLSEILTLVNTPRVTPAPAEPAAVEPPTAVDGFGPVDATYRNGDRVTVGNRAGHKELVGVVVAVSIPEYEDGRTVPPWDLAYEVATIPAGRVVADTTMMRREIPVQVGQTWVSTRADGQPSALTVVGFDNQNPGTAGLVVQGEQPAQRILIGSPHWALVKSGPHEPTGTVRRCDVGGEQLDGPWWMLHGLGRGWESDHGAACAYHAGQPARCARCKRILIAGDHVEVCTDCDPDIQYTDPDGVRSAPELPAATQTVQEPHVSGWHADILNDTTPTTGEQAQA